MNEQKAREILGDAIDANNNLDSLGWYLAWGTDYDEATLDGKFSSEQLLAIAWWMDNKKS